MYVSIDGALLTRYESVTNYSARRTASHAIVLSTLNQLLACDFAPEGCSPEDHLTLRPVPNVHEDKVACRQIAWGPGRGERVLSPDSNSTIHRPTTSCPLNYYCQSNDEKISYKYNCRLGLVTACPWLNGIKLPLAKGCQTS